MVEVKYIGKCLLISVGRKKILVVGDLHLGYEEYLNRTGVFFSRQMFKEVTDYFDRIFERVGKVSEVVLLGDVKHDFGSITRQESDSVLKLIDYLEDKCKKILIVKGNHDKILEPIVSKRKIIMRDFYILGQYCFAHGDKDFEEMYRKGVKVWVIGHGHPAIRISDPGGVKREKYKCFLVGRYRGRQVVIVPSFFEVNKGSDPRENDLGLAWKFNFENFEVKVSEENLKVLAFGLLKNL